jgi:serine/threonine protein kinase
MGVPERIGRYEIVAEIGRGAMGSVFKARDPIVGRIVALKTIHSAALAGEQSHEYRARFQREARASGVLAHPGIVPVFDVGEDEGAPFLVMEFVDGRTLADAMKKGERFPLDRVCDIGQQIAEALGYAHRQGVIHRDIKPANVLLTSREVYGSERPRITDFGIAKLAASEITTHGQLLGTPSFMPPEQFTGTPVDGRADLFSLGVILYSLATGEQPFAGETMTAVSYKVVYTEPIPPSKLNPAISPRLQAAILKCLAKNPAERYQTGEEVAQELTAIRLSPGAAANLTALPALDADATLGPVQAGVTAGSLPPSPVSSLRLGEPSAPLTVQANSATAQTKPASSTGSGTGTGQKRKPVTVETLFAVILLGIAGLGIAIAGGWFTFQHLIDLAMHKHPQVSAPVSQPVQPVVTVPQVSTTQPTADQSQTNGAQTSGAQMSGVQTSGAQTTGAQTTTPAASAPAANAPSSATGSAPTAASAAPAKTTAKNSASPASKQAALKAKSSAKAVPPSAANLMVAKTGPVPAPPASSPAVPPSAATAAPAPASPGVAAAANPAPAAFNPRKLDPNASTKLKIELSKLPGGLPVNVEMNRKPYLSFVTGDKTDLENLYVPAGVQEFRVVIESGGQNFGSNVVSDDFKAKKKKTLKVELLQDGHSPSKIATPLGKDTQVFLSFPLLSF